jgi:hypothetical protein
MQALLPTEGGCGDAGLALGQAWAAARRLRDQDDCATLPTEENESCV